jgi:gamma-glutamylcyclotransferase (GGCT)/AIG2-like uncharacterized protein YtfP
MFYFAYGSNMDLSRIEDLGLHFQSIQKGVLPGWKLAFNVIDNAEDRSGYANITPDSKAKVEGLIIETNQAAIKKLDWNEDAPDYYQKKKVAVVGADGKKIECLTYVGNPKRLAKGLKPRKIYLAHLLDGRLFLEPDYLKHLERIKTLD